MRVPLSTLVALFGLAFVPMADAQPPKIQWKSDSYSHIADDEPLATLLREFAADQGLAIVVSDAIQAKIRGRFGPMKPAEYLDAVTRQNGLIWYYDGATLFVYRGEELQSEIMQLRQITPDTVRAALRDLEIPEYGGTIKVARESGLVHISGPPRFVTLVTNLATRLEATAIKKAAVGLSVRVFPLRHAWAEDQEIGFREATIVVPGVASVLRNLVGISGKTATARSTFRRTPAVLPTLAGTGLAAVGDNPKRTPLDPYLPQPPANLVGVPQNIPVASTGQETQTNQSISLDSEEGLQPSIQAEPRLNAVIIQDVADRFPTYEQLIATLDVPVGLVEIEAMIIDVAANKNFALGLPLNLEVDDDTAVSLSLNPVDQANLTFTLVSGGVQRLLLQLQALATQGHARVVARPAVLTLDNVEAHLDSTQTIYVRVPGTYANDLFNITVGTSLRVTPHIIDDGGIRRVKLQVRVEDGTPVTNVTVDNIPTVQRNTINTQAVLAEDQSLFLGGLTRDEKNLTERGIPWLKDIPKLGFLFRTTISSTTKTERYVLLTPRIVSIDAYGTLNGGVRHDDADLPCPPSMLPSSEIPSTGHVRVPVATASAPPKRRSNDVIFEPKQPSLDNNELRPIPAISSRSMDPKRIPMPTKNPVRTNDESQFELPKIMLPDSGRDIGQWRKVEELPTGKIRQTKAGLQ